MNISLFCCVFFADRLLKGWAKDRLPEGASKTVIPGRLYLLRIRNYGLSGNRFSSRPIVAKRISALTLLIAALYYLFFMKTAPKAVKTGFALMLSGGLSNLTDRIQQGYVTDFISFKDKYARVYNPADFLIYTGALLALLSGGKRTGK